ncbi:hypothetical protein Q7P35_004236 [Cladosporium inversicolor]
MDPPASPGHIGPEKPLPYGDEFSSTEEYIEGLLNLAGSNELLQTLCGGVHILDFFTSTPDLYTRILPQEWRDFFLDHSIIDILDLLMREDLASVTDQTWREGAVPPDSLVEYVRAVRKHLLTRLPFSSQCARNRAMKPTQKLTRNVAVGMNVKKVHEVGIFSSYVHNLTSSISDATGHPISHLVDFGSGQNYLGRALASEPYNRNIVAIESRGHNQDRALKYDITARLRPKEVFPPRNKKLFRAGLQHPIADSTPPTPLAEQPTQECEDGACAEPQEEQHAKVQLSAEGKGTIQYVEHWIEDGNLTNVLDQIVDPAEAKKQIASTTSSTTPQPQPKDQPIPHNLSLTPTQHPNAMVISLHSCGNLLHHAIRSLTLNSSVRAICLVGCCYNLMTERLTPATYKLPALRPAAHPRLETESTRGDPHGFPMSARFCTNISPKSTTEGTPGVKLNITARMMAVQAPQNWTEKESSAFFTRHFYRALLQRLFLDLGIIPPPDASTSIPSPSPTSGNTAGGTPIIIGSLRKIHYSSFPAYVCGALEKLYNCPERGNIFKEKFATMSDEYLAEYERSFARQKHELSVVWSLMAFSAGVVESLIVVDRWCWLQEQEEVREAWVEPVFDYGISPRNMVVVGIKK